MTDATVHLKLVSSHINGRKVCVREDQTTETGFQFVPLTCVQLTAKTFNAITQFNTRRIYTSKPHITNCC